MDSGLKRREEGLTNQASVSGLFFAGVRTNTDKKHPESCGDTASEFLKFRRFIHNFMMCVVCALAKTL